jgi:hypothetical protein
MPTHIIFGMLCVLLFNVHLVSIQLIDIIPWDIVVGWSYVNDPIHSLLHLHFTRTLFVWFLI